LIPRADFDPLASDADFLVESEVASAMDRVKDYFALREALGALLCRPLDPVEDGAIRNPDILRDVAEHQQVLYAARSEGLPLGYRECRSRRTFTDGRNLEGYLNDEMLRAAVKLKFGIAGEALSQLLRYFPEYHDRITLVGQIAAFRNQIVHWYVTLRDDIVGRLPAHICPSCMTKWLNCWRKAILWTRFAPA